MEMPFDLPFQAISTYSFGNLGWLGLQALPLAVWPDFISSLLREEFEHASCEPTANSPLLWLCRAHLYEELTESALLLALEKYYARSLGFSLFSLALVIVILSGALPLTGETNSTCLRHLQPGAWNFYPHRLMNPYS